MQINAINNYKYQQPQFESRKNKEVQKPVHSANIIKAIPVAVLVAMSPVTKPLYAQNDSIKTEYVNYTENDLLGQQFNNGVTPDGTHCRMTVYTAEDKKKSVKVNLTKRIQSYAVDQNNNVVNAFRIREVELIPESVYKKTESVDNPDGSKDVKTRYYVIGSGTEYTSVPMAKSPNITLNQDAQPIIKVFNDAKYEINAELYKNLKPFLKK